jgi:hypothetical protein
MKFENFVGGFYESQSLLSDAEDCLNWFPELVESAGGSNQYVLYRTPELSVFGP